jgi:hypothetical protein
MVGTASAEVEIYDSFENTLLSFKKTETVFDYYDVLGKADSGFTQVVRVRNELLGNKPAILENGPLGAQSWVFSTGSSTKWRDVHWRHLVDIRYNFDHLMSSAAVSFKYLNTRACGGRVDLIFVEYAEDGSVLWYKTKRFENWENWPGPYTRLPGTINDRTWRDYGFTLEETAAFVEGKSFNCIIIREYPRKGKGTLYLYMNYNKGQIDLKPGKVDVRVQLSQDGQTVQVTGQKSLKKSVKKARKGQINRIYYKESRR